MNVKAKTGSKPKKAAQPEPVEFNYEEEAETAYANAMDASTAQVPSASSLVEFDYAGEEQLQPTSSGMQMPVSIGDMANIYIVTGSVRLDRQGQKPIVAEQVRLVYARDFNEAVAKYNAYFTSMSGDGGRYTVLGASGSEAIR